MAERKGDPGYCIGCGRVIPCSKARHTIEEQARIDLARQQGRIR